MPVIDITTFNELKEMSGEDYINELIDAFLDDAPDMIRNMRIALEAKDVESFRRNAHSMKSNAATFGANGLAALAKELEALGRENKLHETGDRLKALEDAYASVCDELKGLKS